jgi:hypothetical protein
MAKQKIVLPSVISKDCWFYKDNEELCKPHLNKPYISYSSVSSWCDYKNEFIKQKFAGIKLPDGIYGKFGTWCGHMLEHGCPPKENPDGFTGEENFDYSKRTPTSEYEKMILIDRGDYVIIGFIDQWDNGILKDQKSGGKGKEAQYQSVEYIQAVLYAYAMELQGQEIKKVAVDFLRREKSHINPPLHLSKEQFEIPLEYSPERVKFALNKVDKAVKEISDLYSTYLKCFK